MTNRTAKFFAVLSDYREFRFSIAGSAAGYFPVWHCINVARFSPMARRGNVNRKLERSMLQLISDRTQPLKEFTENNYAQAAFFWTALLKNKEIKVNGKRVDKNITVYKGDVISYYLTAKQAEKKAFSVVYQDERILVVDKDSGVNSEAVFAALSREDECYFIHRLDRNTKGLLVFARQQWVERELLKAFKTHKVEKRYHALCIGYPVEARAVLTAYLKKDAEKSLVKIYDEPVKGSEEICTEYKILSQKDGLSKVEILLHTGKTHQIRAHFAHIGCPIVGDMKYGNTERNKALQLARQCLVAKYLRLELGGALAYLSEKEFVSEFEVE